MKVKVISPGSATVINAISMGCGSAFGIGLYVTATATIRSSGIECQAEGGYDTGLMEKCVLKVLDHFQIHPGVTIKTTSTLPAASGLSSSSATSNAVIMATYEALIKEGLVESGSLTGENLLMMGIDASLDAGVTITGALDDASASFFGGWTLTNNLAREIIRREEMEGQNILIYMPHTCSPTAQSNVGRMKLLAPWVNIAFREAQEGNLAQALTLNGLLHCAALEFDSQIALDALEAGAKAAGLSGTGPSFVALVGNEKVDQVLDIWKSYPGRIIKTFPDNEGTRVVLDG